MSAERDGFAKSTPEEVRRGKTNMMIGVEDGFVFVRYPQPMLAVVMEPQNAFDIGEQLARAAHRARFGEDPPDDRSYLANQIRERLTDEMRSRMINRVIILLNNRDTNPKTPGYWAMQIVDSVFNAVA